MAPWASRLVCVFCVLRANRTREVKRDFCDLPIRRNEGRVVNTPLVFKRVLIHEERGKTGEREEREKKKESRKEETEKEREGDGKREEESGRERERSPPCMEKRAESEIGVERQ
ncbi:hypothetical protein TNCV_3969591 [Trichonephila clavipes]|nr:hypothetical protein TNCV_3969591 [Trichonephila clavipes]